MLATWAIPGPYPGFGLTAGNAHGSGRSGSITPDDHAGFSARGMPCPDYWPSTGKRLRCGKTPSLAMENVLPPASGRYAAGRLPGSAGLAKPSRWP
jgi:hypothetical protein